MSRIPFDFTSKQHRPQAVPFGSLCYGSVTTAAEDQQRDDQDPDPVIAKEITQTAVIHESSSVSSIWREAHRRPRIIIL